MIEKTKAGVVVLKETFQEFVADDCPRMAAALSYYTVFSLPPLLVVLITVAGLALEPQHVERWIREQVGGVIGPTAAEQIQTMIEGAQKRVRGGSSAGLLLAIGGLLFGATGAFAQLQRALNRVWEVQPDPERGGVVRFLRKRLFSLGMIVAVAFLLLVALVISSLISGFSNGMGGRLPEAHAAKVAWALDLGLSLVIFALLFATIFRVLPDARVSWRTVRIGAFATAALFVLGKFLIALYVGRSNPGEAYGAAAALAMILIWVYYSAMILFLGAEFTQVWARRFGEGIRPERNAVRVIQKEERIRPGDTWDS